MDELLDPDEVIQERWKVEGRLGGGGFGDVFIGYDFGEHMLVAIKAENKEHAKESLRMEVGVLKRLQRKKHAAKFYGCGQTWRAMYVVMQLLSKNLSELRRERYGARYSPGTAYRLSFQALQAIREVHSIGFLHRDVKPSNFAMGLSKNDCKTVFILDFGLCRQYLTGDGKLRRSRAFCPFRGTTRYCSIRAHERKELGRGDDVQGLFYMIIEMVKAALPWRKLTDREEAGEKKRNETVENLCRGMPNQILELGRHLEKVTSCLGEPDYDLLEGYLRAAACEEGGVGSWSESFDWEHEQTDSCSSDTLTTY